LGHTPVKEHCPINHHEKKTAVSIVFLNHKRRKITRGCDNHSAGKVPKDFNKNRTASHFLIVIRARAKGNTYATPSVKPVFFAQEIICRNAGTSFIASESLIRVQY
jgi:hypothetical protein